MQSRHGNPKQILEYLSKIQNSKEFSSARLDSKLLTYLVESTLAKKHLKETTIAIDVFDKDASFNPAEDSSVRSHIYSVRKKLKAYYTDEGSSDKLVFIIPKGQYLVSFRNSQTLKFINKKTLPHIVWATALVLITLFLGFPENIREPRRENPIFKDFLKSDLPTMIVVGDYYFFTATNFPYSDISRITSINSDADFDNFVKDIAQAEQYMEKTDNSYIGQDVVFGLQPILNELYPIRSRVKIRLASKLTYVNLNENNIIFLGTFKNMGILRNLMDDFQIQPKLDDLKINVQDADTNKVYDLIWGIPDHTQWREYSIAAKIPGHHNNTIMLISTFNSWDSGTTARELVNGKLLEKIQEKFIPNQKTFPRYFEILFEISGYQRTGLSIEPVYLFEK